MGNRLAEETSPYLLQHAENPVEWYPWGEEAFRLAQEGDQPIFLSVGYAACHWCHVMAHESFEDPETAAVMNEHFINIKVDREERPDVDALYMDAVVMITGQGGWPMSVFLTPEGEPFYGGTYFPPSPRYNMPSFRDVLNHLSREWRENRAELLQLASDLKARIAATPSLIPIADNLNEVVLDQSAENLFNSFDWSHGGWGGAPKFPQASTIEFLLRRHHRTGDKLAIDMATQALNHMARGGIYDQLGGGFHRYAVDDHWLVPHFEKMLYDNALLAQVYLHAWQVTQNGLYRRIVEETLEYLIREMRHSDGGFFSSLDADSEGVEGKFYVWTPAEIRAAIEDQTIADQIITRFALTESGNFEGMNVLSLPDRNQKDNQPSLEQNEIGIQEGRRLLLKAREIRIRPDLDDKILTAWNGFTLSTFAEAARAFNRKDYLEVAQTLASFLLENLQLNGHLARSWRDGLARQRAFLEDHAALGVGLLALYQADFDPRWFHAAVAQADEILAMFSDPQGGFFDVREDHEQLIARPKSIQDSPTPSGNSLAIQLLLVIGGLTGESRFWDHAEPALRAMQDQAARYPTAFAGWLTNLDLALGPTMQLAIIGSPGSSDVEALTEVANQLYLPRLVLAGGEPETEGSPPLLLGRDMLDQTATAYLCQGFTCKLPTNSPQILLEQLKDSF